MAITSIGYAGQITAANWPQFSWNLVAGYTLGAASHLKVTATTGDRTVAIANGVAVGAGVMDTCTSLTPISLPSVSSGSRWDLIALRRNWSTNTTTVVRVAGSATRVIPAAREATPGTIDDQPLALVRVAAGSTLIQEIVDLRIWVADGGASAGSDLVLSYASDLGTQLLIGSTLWLRAFDPVTGSAQWLSTSLSQVVAGTPRVGSGPGGVTIQQAGTRATTLNGSSVLSVTFPTPFPNGLLAVVATPSDAGTLAKQVVISAESLSGFSAQCLSGTGTSLANTAARINWIAIGW